MSSIVAREVSGLIGAYIRAWFYGVFVGAGIALWAMSGHNADLHPEDKQCDTVSPTELPCMEKTCLEAFGFTAKDWDSDRKKSVD